MESSPVKEKVNTGEPAEPPSRGKRWEDGVQRLIYASSGRKQANKRGNVQRCHVVVNATSE